MELEPLKCERKRLQLAKCEEKNTFYIKPFYRNKRDGKTSRRVIPNRLPLEVSSPLTRFSETCDYTKTTPRHKKTVQPQQHNALLEMRRQLDELREQSKGGPRKELSDLQSLEVEQDYTSAIQSSQASYTKDDDDGQSAENLDESFNESIESSNDTGEESTQSYDLSCNFDNATANTSMTDDQEEDEEVAIRLLSKTSLLDTSQDGFLPKFDFEPETKSPELDSPNKDQPDPSPFMNWNVTHTERCNYLLFGPTGKHHASSPSPHRIFPPTIRQEHVKHLIRQLINEPYIPMAPYTEYSQRIRPRTLEGQEYLPIVVVEAFMMKWMSKASYKFFEREDQEYRKPCRYRRDEGFNMMRYRAVMRSAINTWTQNYEYEEPASEEEEGEGEGEEEEEQSEEEEVEEEVDDAAAAVAAAADDDDWEDEDEDPTEEQV